MTVTHEQLLQHLKNVLQFMRWSRLQLGLEDTERSEVKTKNSNGELKNLPTVSDLRFVP